MVMTRRKLMRIIDSDRIKEAIRTAEQRTSGEICISVSSLFWGNVEKAAERAFVRLGMTHTKQRNGVLLFVVPSRRKFVIIGDTGIHEKVGQEFWSQVADKLAARFREGDFSGGLCRGIEEVGDQLATHFPCDKATDVDELSNEVDFE
jgi:uncharacterized membrane protein